ncbi:MAG: polysaccharide biosynthesis/export family protein [Candidatus Omnitrophica bacterium]|nr:polysaccharide biosynthesis/export family protein [Candidatus Omnitrophota bacterium]
MGKDKTLKTIFLMAFILDFGVVFAFGQDSRDVANQHYLKGRQYYQQGDYQAAQEEFQKALSVFSQGEARPEYLEKISQKEEAPDKESSVQAQAPKVIKQEPPALHYTIGVGDVLYISVWQEDKLSQDVIVRPDGMISFPLAGDVPAAGLTIPELDEELTKRLEEFIRYPEVSIMVKKSGGQKIIVLGEVTWPGVYYVTGSRTVLEAVALANGFTPHAVLSSVIIVRGDKKNPKGIRVNLSRAIEKNDSSQNIVLQPEDIVYVPKKFIANVNYFVSQFMAPIASEGEKAATIRTTRW